MTESSGKQTTLSALRRYGILAYGAFGTMLDVGLMVLGSLLVGLGVAVVLAGFDLIGTDLELSTAAVLVSALVLSVAGLFCFGVASEGPLGRGRRLVGYQIWEVGVGRVVAAIVLGFGAVALYEFLSGFLDGLPVPLHQGTDGIRAVGVAGMTVVPLIAVPVSLTARFYASRVSWLARLEAPLIFVVWMVGAMVLLG